jgi:chitinase
MLGSISFDLVGLRTKLRRFVVYVQHLFYSFAGIDETEFTMTTTNPDDEEHMKNFVALKKKKPSLKTYIAVGGWDVGGKVFSDMTRFPGTRKAFIDSALSWLEDYGFDGIDIDWEYPAADDRGQ